MREKYKSCVILWVALLFMGITFPELVFSDEDVQVVDANGDELIAFSDLPGDTLDHIKALYQGAEEGRVLLRFKLLSTQEEE